MTANKQPEDADERKKTWFAMFSTDSFAQAEHNKLIEPFEMV